mmetsp:Transcript_10812/g.35818  ORF Transcript_10812/g.35818 Transcript_10812/m.35818 type:complete len:369 (+) Transcript_10812:162-1268(+)
MCSVLFTSLVVLGGGAFGFAPLQQGSPQQRVLRAETAEADAAYGASHTSFYTSEEKKDSYEGLESVLARSCADDKLRTCITEMLDACAEITKALRSALVTVEGSSNTFGDVQLTVDVIADELMWQTCRDSAVVYQGASEEEPEIKECNPDGQFVVCWDPLDGSSIVDNNWAVGTLVGVWDKSTGLIGATGRDQKTSIVALYGPRTTVLVALDDGVYEFTYGAEGQEADWICSREQISISTECKLFAPANMRAAQDLPGYKDLIDHYMNNRYTLRYSGGLVPDVYQQFTKQQGVFANPTSPASPAKLRLAFEAAPFGLLVEKAGGSTSDGVTGGSVLDVEITAVDQRTALCIGSSQEVDRFNSMICMIE